MVLLATALYGCGAPPASGDLSAFPLEIRGREYAWHVRFPGTDGELGTPDDITKSTTELHLPAQAEVAVVLESDDLLYVFYLPQLPLKEVAVPGVPMRWTLETGSPRTLELRGDQFCGYSHRNLLGSVVIEERESFARWLAAD